MSVSGFSWLTYVRPGEGPQISSDRTSKEPNCPGPFAFSRMFDKVSEAKPRRQAVFEKMHCLRHFAPLCTGKPWHVLPFIENPAARFFVDERRTRVLARMLAVEIEPFW